MNACDRTQVERLKEAILSRVQHELRTPVAIATMAFELLSSGAQDPRTDEHCKELLGKALKRLSNHLRNLSLLSPSSPKRMGPRLPEVDVAALARSAAEEIEALARERDVEVSLSIPDHARRPLRLDGEHVRLALRNLLENAVRFNRPGGRVGLAVSFAGAAASVRIEDDGIGMSPDTLDRALEGFFQEEDFLTRREGGLGIGLAAARRAVEAHGGRLDAYSRAGKGSVFVVTFEEAQ